MSENVKTMKALVFEDFNKMVVQEYPIPEPADNEVLIRVAYCGICATDYDNFKGISSFAKEGKLLFPLRWGHEWSGRICKVGKNVTKFKVGDRVTNNGRVTCGECSECKAGRRFNCKNLRSIGTVGKNIWPGGMAEYTTLPEVDTLLLNDAVSFQAACAMEPATIALNGLRDIPIEGSTVLVIGSGPIGVMGAHLAKALGAKKVIIAARKKPKLDLALKLGADVAINTTEEDIYQALSECTDGSLADVVLDTAGEASYTEHLTQLLRKGGHFTSVAFYNRYSNVNFDDIVLNKMTFYGRSGSNICTPQLMDLISEGKADVTPIISSMIDFYKDGPTCMDFYEGQKSVGTKVLIKVYGEDA